MATVLDKFCDSYGEGSPEKSAARLVLETKYREELHRMRQCRCKIPPDTRIMAKELMERIIQSVKEEPKIAECHRAEGEYPDPIAKSSREGVPEELQRWRDAFTMKMAREACREGGPAYSAGIFCSGGCLDTFAAIRSGFKPLWGTEVHKQRGAMFEDLTGAPCLGDTFAVDFKKQRQVALLWTGQPCPDYSTSHQGRRPPGSRSCRAAGASGSPSAAPRRVAWRSSSPWSSRWLPPRSEGRSRRNAAQPARGERHPPRRARSTWG